VEFAWNIKLIRWFC